MSCRITFTGWVCSVHDSGISYNRIGVRDVSLKHYELVLRFHELQRATSMVISNSHGINALRRNVRIQPNLSDSPLGEKQHGNWHHNE